MLNIELGRSRPVCVRSLDIIEIVRSESIPSSLKFASSAKSLTSSSTSDAIVLKTPENDGPESVSRRACLALVGTDCSEARLTFDSTTAFGLCANVGATGAGDFELPLRRV